MNKIYLPCETIAKHILPIFRSIIARELIEKHNFNQIATAERLGTTQAAISQYLHSKRGYKSVEEFQDILPTIEDRASIAAGRIAKESIGVEDVMLSFCELCTLIRKARANKKGI